jgi:hypothetical protein
MVIKSKSRSLIIETLIKKKQTNKALKHVQNVVTEKQKDGRNDKELNDVELSIKNRTSITTSSTMSSPSIASRKDRHTLNANESSPKVSTSVERSQRKALLLKKYPHLPKSSPNKKCDDEDPKALPILKSVNSSSTHSSGVSRREKMSRAMKTIDLHRRRNKSLRDGEIVSRSSINSFVQGTSVSSSSFASVPSSTTPLCILSDLTKVSEDTRKNLTDATGIGSPQSTRYGGDSRSHQIPQVGSEYYSTPEEHKRYLAVSTTSGKYLENNQYSSFPRKSTNRSVKESGNFPNNDEYSVKAGGRVSVVSVGKPIRHTKETIGRTYEKVSSQVKRTTKTGTSIVGQDKPSLDPHCVNVQTKSIGEKPILLNCQSVQSISNLQIKDNFESKSSLNTQTFGRGKANVPKDTKKLSKSESTIGSEKSLIVDTYLSMSTQKTPPVNVENIVGRSLSYEVAIVGSTNGFETEYKNYHLDDLDLSGHSFVLNPSDSTEIIRNSRSYSTTCTESRTLNSLCSITKSWSDDDRKYTSNKRRTGSKSAHDYKKPSISLSNDSGSTSYSYSASHDDSMTLYEDDEDASQSIYSQRSRDKNENFFFSSWCR